MDRDTTIRTSPLEHLRHKKLQYLGEQAPQIKLPSECRSFEELDIDETLVHQFIIKHLFNAGTLRNDAIAQRMGVPLVLLEKPIAFLRNQAQLQIHRRDSGSIADLLFLELTERGRRLAHEYMEDCAYCGVLPVSYEAYCEQVLAQTVKHQITNRTRIEAAFSELVVNTETLTNIGTAFNSGESIFLYGPSGTGKSFMASQVVKLLTGNIAIPYAVLVEGQIIRVFDRNNHHPVDSEKGKRGIPQLIKQEENLDQRWVTCKRPVIIAAGELTLQMLDLQFQPDAGFYEAPLQMKANGGVFIIDDLGRQIVKSTVLLNRWILPLETGSDYLGLHTGSKFQIPFDVIPIFSTNIQPEELADQAFLRRLGYKINVDYVNEEEYAHIFEQYCELNNIPFTKNSVDYLIEKFYRPNELPLLASHPKEIINKIIDFCLFEGEEPALSDERLAMAWRAFFINHH